MKRGWIAVWMAALVGVAGCEFFVTEPDPCRGPRCSKLEGEDGGSEDAGSDAGTDAGVQAVADAGDNLKVVNWNVLWFGHTDPEFGLADDDLQGRNIATVLARLGADIYGLQEVVDPARLQGVIASLPGYAGFSARDAIVTSGSASYSTFEAKPAFVYRTSTVEVLSVSVDPAMSNTDFAGRPPLRVDVRVTKPNGTRELTVLVVHLKASGGLDNWQLRQNASVQLKTWLDSNLPAQDVLVIGDWNDDLDQSYVEDQNGTPLPTPFANFNADPANWSFATQLLTDLNTPTTRYDTPIDHQLMSNEVAPFLVSESVKVVRPDQLGWVSSYSSTTSDHYPVSVEYRVANTSTGTIELLAPNGGELFDGGQSAEVEWLATGMDRVRVDISTDGGSWRSLAATSADAGALAVIVPNVATTAARFRVANADNPTVFDVSDGPFTITRSVPAVFINEVRYDEPGTTYAKEFVEVVNGGTHDVDLTGWRLFDSGAAQYTFASGTVLQPGKAIVVFGSAAEATASGQPNAVGGGLLSFHDTDRVELRDNLDVIVDTHSWVAGGSPGDGISVNRSPDGVAGGPFVSHRSVSSTDSSPGRRADGGAF